MSLYVKSIQMVVQLDVYDPFNGGSTWRLQGLDLYDSVGAENPETYVWEPPTVPYAVLNVDTDLESSGGLSVSGGYVNVVERHKDWWWEGEYQTATLSFKTLLDISKMRAIRVRLDLAETYYYPPTVILKCVSVSGTEFVMSITTNVLDTEPTTMLYAGPYYPYGPGLVDMAIVGESRYSKNELIKTAGNLPLELATRRGEEEARQREVGVAYCKDLLQREALYTSVKAVYKYVPVFEEVATGGFPYMGFSGKCEKVPLERPASEYGDGSDTPKGGGSKPNPKKPGGSGNCRLERQCVSSGGSVSSSGSTVSIAMSGSKVCVTSLVCGD